MIKKRPQKTTGVNRCLYRVLTYQMTYDRIGSKPLKATEA